jgi:hypothetical protein
MFPIQKEVFSLFAPRQPAFGTTVATVIIYLSLSPVFIRAKVISVSALRLTDEELEQVTRACFWVKVTAGFLPYMRKFLLARLAPFRMLQRKIARLTATETFRLWERIKDRQLFPSALSEKTLVGGPPQRRTKEWKDEWTAF